MIGLDTNVLVRYLTLDDTAQSALASRVFDSLSAESPGYISLIVIIELAWVLESSYGFEKDRIIDTIDALLRAQELTIERGDTVRQALRRYAASGADFADCVIDRCGEEADCEYTLTFDKRAAAAGMRWTRDFIQC
jgi:predicted nucleic-acid-binding protein